MTVNRYQQLLVSIPKGSFYDANGFIIPHKDSAYQLSISTNIANREYIVYLNSNMVGFVTTNAQSVAELDLLLALGDNEIKLVDAVTQSIITSFVTTRDSATLLAAEAEVFEDLDTGIEQVLSDSRLATASSGLIEQVFGLPLSTSNTPGYTLDVYRELLQRLRAAYRYYGATIEGISEVVRAFTQISPIVYPRSFGPSTVLDSDFISVDRSGHTYYVTSAPLTNLQGTGANVQLVSVDRTVGVGTGTVQLLGGSSPKKLQWKSSLNAYGPLVDVTANGTYTLYDGEYTPQVLGEAQTFNISTGNNDRLLLEIGNKGIVDITLTAGAARTAVQVAADINAAFNADPRYGASYNTTASSVGTGNNIALNTPSSGTDTSGITIHAVDTANDATQTLFNIPTVRAGLSGAHLAGATTLHITNIYNSAFPLITQSDDYFYMIVGRTTYNTAGAAPNTAITVAGSEMVKVTAIDLIAGTLTIETGLVNNQPDKALVELVGQMPFKQEPILNTRSIQISIGDITKLPVITQSDTFTIHGSGLPDSWILTDTTGGAISPQGPVSYTYFDTTYDLPFQLAPSSRVTIPIPDDVLKYKGWTLLFAVYGYYIDPSVAASSTTVSTIGWSVDDGTTWHDVAATSSGVHCNTTHQPLQFSISTILDSSATKVLFRINLSAGTGNFVVHKVRLYAVDVHDAAFLGHRTIPRGEADIKQGVLIYTWCRDTLTSSENDLLGLTTVDQSKRGHIDNISPTQAYLHKFNVTEFSGGSPLNVAGVFDDVAFTNGTATNMSLVLRTPSRFTYMTPATISSHTENITWSPSAPYQYTLQYASDQVVLTTIILENGIPLLDSDWSYVSNTVIQKTSAPNPTATYTVTYNALIRFESGAIDAGASFNNYIWFGDYDVFLRPNIQPQLVNVTTGIQFDANGLATLDDQSNLDQSASTLTEDTGLSKRIIPQSQWSYQDSTHVQISIGTFNPDALYTLAYTSMVNHPGSTVDVTAEIRTASTSGGLAGATYAPLTPNMDLIGAITYDRYYQIRITFNNIIDTRDVRLNSLLVKGFNEYGVGGSIPVLRR